MGTAQQIPQHGLGLVVGVVSQQDTTASVLSRAIREKIMAYISRSGLHRFPTLRHLRRHVGAPDLAGQPQFFGEAPHELRVFRRCAPAQAMVEMTNHQMSKARRDQHLEQRYRIRTTRNANQPALPARSIGKPWDIGNNWHGHKLIRPKDSRNFYRPTPRKQANSFTSKSFTALGDAYKHLACDG
jgi:hypothetical protein